MEIDFAYYLGIARRRFLLIVVPAIIVLVIGLIAVAWIPPLYRSSATILVESQQIPEDLVRSTVTAVASQRIQVIEQRLMTRENLLRVVQKYKLFPEENLSSTDLVDRMREATEVEQVFLGGPGNRTSAQAIAFTVAFEYPDPQAATQVANEFVTLILDEDLRSRTNQASEATRFLTAEADRLIRELGNIETQIAEYKTNNRGTLPETLDERRARLNRQYVELSALDRELESLADERKLWEMRGVTQLPGAGPNSLSALIAQARVELAQKRASFTEAHPEVKRLVQRIQELEKAAADPTAQVTSEAAVQASPPELVILENREAALTRRRDAVSESIPVLEKSIADTMQVELGLATLVRQQQETQVALREANAKLDIAKTGERLEENRQAERFEVIEQPTVPTEPVWPNRPLFFVLAAMASLAAGASPIVVTEVMNPAVRRSVDVERRLGRPALASIPLIESKRDQMRGARVKRAAALIAGWIRAATAYGWRRIRRINVAPAWNSRRSEV